MTKHYMVVPGSQAPFKGFSEGHPFSQYQHANFFLVLQKPILILYDDNFDADNK